MSDIGVKKYCGKEPPPFTVRYGYRIHQPGVTKPGTGMRLDPEKKPDNQNPAKTRPVKQNALRGNFLPPRPVPVLRVVLFENLECTVSILCLENQSPSRFVREVNGRFNALADQNKAPIHGLSLGTSRNSGSHYFNHRA